MILCCKWCLLSLTLLSTSKSVFGVSHKHFKRGLRPTQMGACPTVKSQRCIQLNLVLVIATLWSQCSSQFLFTPLSSPYLAFVCCDIVGDSVKGALLILSHGTCTLLPPMDHMIQPESNGMVEYCISCSSFEGIGLHWNTLLKGN